MEATHEVQNNLPLTEATFFILLSLAPEPNHGYAIMKDVHQLSQGRVMLSTGTLYSALKRLLEQGWIRRNEATDNNSNGRLRKTYSLTSLGKHILQAEVQRLEGLVSASQSRPIKGIV
jgi:DNA-binding PadR family transcriptional regulator